MSHNRLKKCHRCGCPEEAHFGPTGHPGACGGDLGPACPCLCPRFRDRGEDMSGVNRHQAEISRQHAALYEREPTGVQVANIWGGGVFSMFGVPPEIFRGEPKGELEYGPDTP